MHTIVLLTIARHGQTLKCPLTEEWIQKIYPHTTEYYSATKKAWNGAICRDVAEPRDRHTEWSKTDKYCPMSLISGSQENGRDELTGKAATVTKVANKLSATKGGVGGVGRFRLGDWDWHLYTTTYTTDNSREPTVQHRELSSMLCGDLKGHTPTLMWALPHYRRDRRGQETKPGLRSGPASAKTPLCYAVCSNSARKQDKEHPCIWCPRFLPAIKSCHPQLSLSPRHKTRITLPPCRVYTRIKWEKEETVVQYLLRSP